MSGPDEISMERLLEQAPLHTHCMGYEGDSESTLGTTWFLDPMGEQHSAVSCLGYLRLHILSAGAQLLQEPVEGSRLSSEMTFRTPNRKIPIISCVIVSEFSL